MIRKGNTHVRKHSFTPMQKRLAQIELQKLKEDTKLCVRPEIHNLLLLQSLDGRIRSGHGGFVGNAIPNITFDEVCTLVDLNAQTIRKERQALVSDVDMFIKEVAQGKRDYYKNRDGFPVYGITFLQKKGLRIRNPKQALKGAVLASFMDSAHYRKRTIDTYGVQLDWQSPLEIGSGEEVLMDLDKLKHYEMSPHIFAEGAWSIEWLKDIGIAVDNKRSKDNNVTNVFVRSEHGAGVCDDAALLSIGKLYGLEAMLFGYLVDATDTYGKFIKYPVNGGVDEQIGHDLQEYWKKEHGKPLVSEEEITRIIYLGAKRNVPRLRFSSSHRRFCEHEKTFGGKKSKRPTFLNHVNFLYKNDNPLSYPYLLGFDRFESHKFYGRMLERWEAFDEYHGLPEYKLSSREKKDLDLFLH